ncbi:MAG: hypothetical protein ACOCRO_02060 [Halanaerobiales bacterium]
MKDFTKFTTEDLEDMLQEKRDRLSKMIEISGLQSEIAEMEAIKRELEDRENGETQ